MVKSLLLVCCFLSIMASVARSGVVLIGNNVTLSFEDIEANFAPALKGYGECGSLYLADPLDACSPLNNKVDPTVNDTGLRFVLIVRDGCSFEDKVRTSQTAGFKAAIIYDNVDGDLVAMAGNSVGIKIHAVFVTKASGEVLTKYAGVREIELWIIPNFENSAWSIMAISFISLLAMSAVLATCFFLRRNRMRRERPQSYGMSSRLVKAMPSLIFTAAVEDNCTSSTCTICLEDYSVGEKLRILPCRHKFHALCVDAWLTTWRTFCPVCKRDARSNETDNPPASECTPLLSSSPASVASSSVLSSARSSTSAVQIGSDSASHLHSVSSTPDLQAYNQTYRQSPYLTASQSSHASHLVSPHSLGYCYFSSLGNGSRHFSESASSFSPFASADSLPEC